MIEMSGLGEALPLVAISAAMGLAVVFAVASVAVVRSPARLARGRVERLRLMDVYDAESPSVLQQRRSRFSGLGDTFGWTVNERTVLLLERSGLNLRVGEYIALRLLSVVLAAAGCAMAGRILGGAAAAAAGIPVGVAVGLALPPVLLRRAAQRRAAVIDRQLVELCELMGAMLRSGFGHVQALSATAEELDPPLATEVKRLVDSVRLGGDVDVALEEMSRRLDSPDFQMVATAISVQRRSGGNLAEILEGVARTVRQRQTFKQELAALTARERFSAIIVAGLPLVLVALLNVMDPLRYSLLFTDIRGQVILGLALVMDVAGYIVIKQVSKVEV